jgi:hypothetical protein
MRVPFVIAKELDYNIARIGIQHSAVSIQPR